VSSTQQARVVAVNVAGLYANPSREAELVSQALLGAKVSAEDERDGFCLVHTEDLYEGWVGTQHLAPAWNDEDYFPTSIATLFADVFAGPDAQSELITKLSVGTRVLLAHGAATEDFVPLLLPDKRTGYAHALCLNMTHEGSITGPDLLDQKARKAIDVSALKRQVLAAVGAQAARVALRFIGTPYLWGGSSSFGLDCSGLVQMSYKLSGVQLLRDADLQWRDKRFERVEPGIALPEADLSSGDLVVFGSAGKDQTPHATHIGIALGDGRLVHASATRSGTYVDDCENEALGKAYLGACRLSADADLAVEAA